VFSATNGGLIIVAWVVINSVFTVFAQNLPATISPSICDNLIADERALGGARKSVWVDMDLQEYQIHVQSISRLNCRSRNDDTDASGDNKD
jgi:hypothetical protein